MPYAEAVIFTRKESRVHSVCHRDGLGSDASFLGSSLHFSPMNSKRVWKCGGKLRPQTFMREALQQLFHGSPILGVRQMVSGRRTKVVMTHTVDTCQNLKG